MMCFKLILFQVFVGLSVSQHSNTSSLIHTENVHNVTLGYSKSHRATGASNTTVPDVTKVSLKVFYETLCPASVHFIIKQLQPAMKKLAPYLDVHLVPYGNAETQLVKGRYVFTCQHGHVECYSNKIHACVIEELNNATSAAVDFNACLMQHTTRRRGRTPNYNSIFNWCTYKLHRHMYGVAQCVNGLQGTMLLRDYGIETHAMQIPYVPFLVINQSTDLRTQDQATDNLIGTVCRLLQPTPQACFT